MTRAEEYRLSQYQHLGALREDKSIDLVRNQQTGLIGVQKVISSELYPVYLFLKEHTNPYLPVIYECIQLDENRLLIIEEYETGKNLEECLESGMKFSEEKAAGMTVRPEDKEFIANFYKYAFVGLTLEWVRTGMKDDPAALIERVSTLIHGDITKALEACRIDK